MKDRKVDGPDRKADVRVRVRVRVRIRVRVRVGLGLGLGLVSVLYIMGKSSYCAH